MKMNRTNTAGRILVLLLTALLVLSLAACGKKGNDDMTKPGGEPKNAQEAAAMYKALMDQENAILMENQSLWEKVFMSADKGMTMQEDGKNYGDFLLDTIESAKDKFTADELKLLRQGGEKIREIEHIMGNLLSVLKDQNATADALRARFKVSQDMELDHVIPFSSDRKYSGAAFTDAGTYLMGAAQFLFPEGNPELMEY